MRKPIIKVPTVEDFEQKFYEGSAPLYLEPDLLLRSGQFRLDPEALAETIANQRHAVKQSFHNRAEARHYAKELYDMFMSPWHGGFAIAISPDEIYINKYVTPEFLTESLGHEVIHQTLQKMKKHKASKLLDSPLGLSATIPSNYDPLVESSAMMHSQQRMPTPIDEAMKRYKIEGSY